MGFELEVFAGVMAGGGGEEVPAVEARMVAHGSAACWIWGKGWQWLFRGRRRTDFASMLAVKGENCDG